MKAEFLNDYIDRAAENLGISISPEWKPNVAMFLGVAQAMARMIEATDAASTEAEFAAAVAHCRGCAMLNATLAAPRSVMRSAPARGAGVERAAPFPARGCLARQPRNKDLSVPRQAA